MTYSALVSFALQRCAFDLARHASITGMRDGPELRSRLWFHLAPLGALAPEAAAVITASEFDRRDSGDGSWVTVRVRYPMPLWIPGTGRILGQPADPALTGTLPPFSPSRTSRLPFRWMTAESTVHHEGNGMGGTP